tara:strand:+ start:139 stop:366 length:228 start_codon:yes stop_codon:yes gene_type:complete
MPNDDFGSQIQVFLHDPLMDEVIDSMEREMFEEWAQESNANKREELFWELQGMQRFFRRLRAHVDNASIDARKRK